MGKSRIVAGIDIGSTKISTLVAQVSEDEAIHVIGVSVVPSKGITKGQIATINEASQAILESIEVAERMAGYSVGSAFVSIGGSQIQSQNSTGVVAVYQPSGEINAEDVNRVMDAARAISIPTTREILHVLPRSFTVDGQDGIKDPVGMTGVRLEVDTHIITGSATALKNVTKCVSDVGCDISGLVFSGLASSLSTLTETEKELGVILVDIGGGTTSIAAYNEGALSYSGVLPVGARHVTSDLAAGLRLSFESADRIKLFLSTEQKKKVHADAEIEEREKSKGDDLDLSELNLPEDLKNISRKTVIEGIIRPRLNEIASMVGIELKRAGIMGTTPGGVVLTGGGSLTVGIMESFKRSLALPVRIGSPIGVTGLIDDIKNPSFATANGLLIYGARIGESAGKGFTLPGKLEKTLQNLPVAGLASRVVDLVKSLLP
jgi:cell division protein FtsA